MKMRTGLQTAALLVSLATGGGIGSAQAASSGTLLGVDIGAITSAGNSNSDNVGLTISYLDTYFMVSNIAFLGTIGGPGNNAPAAPSNETITGTISGQNTSGTFSASPYPVVAYDVKAGNDNALYSTGLAGILSGTADTSAITVGNGNNPTFSHVDFFGCVGGCTTSSGSNPGGGTPIPEPASIALLGAGLISLGLARRREAKQA